MVDEVCAFMRDPANRERSLGVAALNKRQAIHIEKLLDKAIEADAILRDYVQAARSAGYYSLPAITGSRNIEEWCTWALEQANRLDPTISSSPSVLDYKDQFYWY